MNTAAGNDSTASSNLDLRQTLNIHYPARRGRTGRPLLIFVWLYAVQAYCSI